MRDVRITIDGVDYLDIKSFTMTYGLDVLARDAQVTFSDRWLNSAILEMPFEEGAPAQVYIDGELMLDGFLDDIPLAYDRASHEIGVSLVSEVAHLEDCSAVHSPGSWADSTMDTIAADLLEPYGIAVEFTNGADKGEPFERFAIEEGETVKDALLRLVRLRDVFLTSNAGRNVIFTRAGTSTSASVLRYGDNIEAGQRTGKYRERFAAYLMKSQTSGRTNWYAADAASPRAIVKDNWVQHPQRVLIVIPDHQCDGPKLERRGIWERNMRAGKSRRYTYQLCDFHNAEKHCWRANELVHITDPFFGLDQPMLCAMVQLAVNDQGTVTTLEFAHKEAYDPFADPPKAKKPKKNKRKTSGWP